MPTVSWRRHARLGGRTSRPPTCSRWSSPPTTAKCASAWRSPSTRWRSWAGP